MRWWRYEGAFSRRSRRPSGRRSSGRREGASSPLRVRPSSIPTTSSRYSASDRAKRTWKETRRRMAASPPPQERHPSNLGARAADLSTKIVQLLAGRTGRGPTRARATLDTNVVTVLYEDAMSRAEHNLAAAGQLEAVASRRRLIQS